MKSRDEMVAMIQDQDLATGRRVSKIRDVIKRNYAARQRRSWVSIGILILAVIPVLMLRRMFLGLLGFPAWAIVPLFFGYFIVVAWLSNRWERKRSRSSAVILNSCIGCGYDLEGLESAVGPDLWVGPERCPECGLEFPAVG